MNGLKSYNKYVFQPAERGLTKFYTIFFLGVNSNNPTPHPPKLTSGPVSTEEGDRIRVQFPVRDIYLDMWPAT